MSDRRRYKKRPDSAVVAVQLLLDFDRFSYRKWGGTQSCKPGDWLVDNAGDVYTVDGDTFAATYRQAGPGQYVKVAAVWAEQTDQAGTIRTKEGATKYEAGDYLVYNDPEGADRYAVPRATFESMYEPV